MYPSLDLADVYAVIAYYLRRRADVDAYVRRPEEEGAAVRTENEARFDPRVRAGRRMAGVFEIGHKGPVAVAIEARILIAEGSLDGEWDAQVRYLPLW